MHGIPSDPWSTQSSGDGEIRVFISSTFEDMKAEREHLVKQVFPELRSICAERGLTFTEIDLRWGITERQARRKKIVTTCLDEIHRHKPYVIGIIGERYGWQPTARDLGGDESVHERYPWLIEAVAAGRSMVELETLDLPLHDPGMRGRVRFYFRDTPANLCDGPDHSAAESARVSALKERIRSLDLPMRGAYADVGSLGEWVREDLLAIIERRAAAHSTLSYLERERRGHEAFAVSRRRVYVPDARTVRRLTRHATWLGASPPRQALPLIVTGESGSGKSSLLSHWSHVFRKAHPDAFIITHHVGATATSSSHLGLMRRVMLEIKDRYGITADVPSEPAKITAEFGSWLGYANRDGLVLVIDGLDQLNEASRQSLHWLPEWVPPFVRLIVSTTEAAVLETLERRGWQVLRIQPLTPSARRAVVHEYFLSFGKQLDSRQVRRIVTDGRSASPFYLVTTMEELRVFNTNEGISRQIEYLMEAGDLDELFQRVLARLEGDYGTELVQQVTRLLWASRSGLSVTELLELTACRRDDLARLLHGMGHSLLDRDGLLGFSHESLRHAVGRRYLGEAAGPACGVEPRSESEAAAAKQLRLALVRYFEAAGPCLRGTLELLFQYRALADDESLLGLTVRPELVNQLTAGEGQWEVCEAWARLSHSGHDVDAALRASVAAWRSVRPVVDRAALLHRLGSMMWDVGRWAMAEELLAELGRLGVTEGQRTWQMQASSGMGLIECMRGRPDVAMNHLDHARRLAEELGDRSGALRVHRQMGFVLMAKGRFAEAMECYGLALAIGEELADPRLLWDIVRLMGVVHVNQGRCREAMECYGRALAISEEFGDRTAVATVLSDIGLLHADQGQFEEAMRCYDRSLAVFEVLGQRHQLAHVIDNMGCVRLNQGRYSEALQCFDRALATYEELGERASIAQLISNMGAIHYNEFRNEEAMQSFERALAIYEEIGDRGKMPNVIGNMGIVLSSQGRFAQALECYNRVLEICQEIGDRKYMARAIGDIGIVHAEMGQYSEAVECLSRQSEICDEIGDRLGAAHAVGGMGRVFSDIGQFDRSLECFARATAVNRAVGSPNDLVGWLQGTASVLLLLGSEPREGADVMGMPEYLPLYVPGATDESWQAQALCTARTWVEESLAIARDIAALDKVFDGTILLARLDAIQCDRDTALRALEELQCTAVECEQRADVRYWLWKISGRDEDRVAAARVISEVLKESPRQFLRKRIEELSADVLTTEAAALPA